jgi:hypothetical protein
MNGIRSVGFKQSFTSYASEKLAGSYEIYPGAP